MRPIDGDKLKRKVQRIATDAWMMKLIASVETTLNQFIDYIDEAPTIDAVNVVRCKCDFGKCHEQGDTLYESSDWDGGIGFDYIRDIKYCPLCGGLLDG